MAPMYIVVREFKRNKTSAALKLRTMLHRAEVVKRSNQEDVFFMTKSSAKMCITTLSDIFEKRETGDFWVPAQIIGIEFDVNAWFYESCKAQRCNKKLEIKKGIFEFSKCGSKWHEGMYRYKIKVRVVDLNGTTPFLLWDHEALDLLSVKVDEVIAMQPKVMTKIPNNLRVWWAKGFFFSEEEVESPNVNVVKEATVPIIENEVLKSTAMLSSPEAMDSLISTKIPDKESDLEYHQAVEEFMIHGPCRIARKTSPCMVNGKYSKQFPKKFVDSSSFNKDGYPLYRRHDDGKTVTRNGIQLDNRVMRLTKNLRLNKMEPSVHHEQLEEFANWLTSISDGTIGVDNDGYADFDIPSKLLLQSDGDPISTIVRSTFPNFTGATMDGSCFKSSAILAPTLEVVNEVNQYM
ncbi:uncharacterized protein LOC116023760 [Ipomoea triloba]|uniref:uncharacterized protein LOC116023760 n=1 Tax=Ipomoea triloba TaxID=35885 RepID=UPI00125CD90B|nr:uncharacterized protein LOC116023760 [Ipomoea triloba]